MNVNILAIEPILVTNVTVDGHFAFLATTIKKTIDGMILSDNETKVDLLNSEPIAKTIVNLITKNPERPITVGVHGDWGAGKSSILEMVETCISNDKDVVCIKFNGWRFQGFEDAKIALIESIVADLVEKRSLATKAGIALKDLYKRIEWLKVAKKTGGLALSFFTGIPSPDMIESVISGLESMANNPAEFATKENLEKLLENGKSILKPKDESKGVPEEISEFRKEFDELLKQAGIKQLIVLVDDLDRCLPETAIETLEAIRLFVFTTKTAFVIAVDEAMIEYAVRRHFPEFNDLAGSQMYARSYLEKLIQVPFRIPILGDTETKIYVTLLLVGAELGENDEGFNRLISEARKLLVKPWEATPLTNEHLQSALGKKNSNDALSISDQIGSVLADGTRGNPRQIKRFLNTLLLRRHAAEARGFGEQIALPVLVKLMVAERFIPRLFEQIAELSAKSTDGVCLEVQLFEQALSKTQNESKTEKDIPGKRSTLKQPSSKEDGSDTKQNPLITEWLSADDICKWGNIQPPLAKIDLRPYIFVSQDKKNYFAVNSGLGDLTTLAEKLLGTKFSVQGLLGDIKALTQKQANQIFDAIRNKIVSNADLGKEPSGIQGLMLLVKTHPHLQLNLVNLLETLPTEKIGPWVLSGWEGIITDQKPKLDEVITGWTKVTNNSILKAAASATKRLPKK